MCAQSKLDNKRGPSERAPRTRHCQKRTCPPTQQLPTPLSRAHQGQRGGSSPGTAHQARMSTSSGSRQGGNPRRASQDQALPRMSRSRSPHRQGGNGMRASQDQPPQARGAKRGRSPSPRRPQQSQRRHESHVEMRLVPRKAQLRNSQGNKARFIGQAAEDFAADKVAEAANSLSLGMREYRTLGCGLLFQCTDHTNPNASHQFPAAIVPEDSTLFTRGSELVSTSSCSSVIK